MSANQHRETLISSGEHLYAIRKLGDTYSVDEYLEAVSLARDVGAGELYADSVLGVDVDAIVTGVEQGSGSEIVRAAERRLRSRGVDPRTASYREFADALVEVSR